MFALKELIGLPALHLELMRGSIKQNERYCAKEGEYVHFGLPFVGKGARRDLQVFYEKVKEGANDVQLAEHDFGILSRTLKATDRIRLAIKPKFEGPRQVILYVGQTGGGKTRLAYESWPDLFELPVSTNLWFDGYQGQETVLLDEFSGQLPLVNALKLLDNYYVRHWPIKGGFVWFNPKRIVVTSNQLPAQWYDYSNRMEEQRALRRRFTKVVHVTGGRQITYEGEEAISVFWPIATGPIVEAVQKMVCHNCYYMPCTCEQPIYHYNNPLPVTDATYNDKFDDSDVDVVFNTEQDS